jgi:radical S-adenosyl methionine domain-containing protein 2
MIINLHLLDACNFRCVHCFAHFGARKTLSYKDWRIIVDNIMENTNVERFNLAGGEPLLYRELAELAEYIRSKGKAVSIITNGYSLSDRKIDILSECGVSMIGLSIDSPNVSTLRKMGRCTAMGDILEPDRCIGFCRHIKARGINLKINTVISQLNWTEDFSSFIRKALPDRWKLLKAKEFKNDLFDNASLLINDAQFNDFILRHRNIPHVVERTMANSYIMIDAFGNLVDTGSNDNTPVANLLNVSFRDAFAHLKFDYGIYRARYAA